MINNASEIPKHYSTQSCISDPGKLVSLLNDIPSDLPELVKIIQGLILHLHWTGKYSVVPSNERKEEANLRFVSKQLEWINNAEKDSLKVARSPERRILGTCRDYSISEVRWFDLQDESAWDEDLRQDLFYLSDIGYPQENPGYRT